MTNTVILTSEIKYEQDVVITRQRARQIAELLGFDTQEQTRIATAVSEISRNAFSYAGGGKISYSVENYGNQQQNLVISIKDEGPGIADLNHVLSGTHRSNAGIGSGIIGAKRLMDQFQVSSSQGKGTLVRLSKVLPKNSKFVIPKQLNQIVETLSNKGSQSPFEEIQKQNQELLQALAEVKIKQEQLEKLNRELEDTNRGVVALYAELDEKADFLQRANDIKTRFLSNMTHEFRTPLNSILSLTEILLQKVDGPLTSEQEKQIRFVRKSAESLSELVNDLLDLAKVEAGKIAVKPIEFKVEETLGAIRGMLKPLLAQNASVNLVIEDPVGIPPLENDEGKISQILRNLVSNAIKFTEKGEVRVSTKLGPSETVIFSVVDTGIGIAKSDLERIFDEFTQIDAPIQKRHKGTGLGLPLSKKLAELLGGKIIVESHLGVGSKFSVILPMNYKGPEIGSYIPQIPKVIDPGRLPVLIIEDNSESLFIYDKFLQDTEFQSIPARSLKEARKIIEEINPGVILTDVLLQGESTWNFISELKTSTRFQKIPLIAVTIIDNEKKLKSIGVDEFHVKPIDRGWLLKTLRKVTEARQNQKILIVDDDEISRYLLRGLLSEIASFTVIEASNGLEGLRIAEEEKPVLIFLDLSMPGLEGNEVLRRLKEHPETSRISVVIHTGRKLTPAELEELNSKATGILSKQSYFRDAALSDLKRILINEHLIEDSSSSIDYKDAING